MSKFTKVLLFFLVFSLFATSVQALGVWDSEGTTHVFEGQNVLVGTNIVRITKIQNQEVFFDIEKFGNIIDSGMVSEFNPSFAVEDEIWIEYKRPSDYYRYGKGAYIEAYAWVDGRIVSHNFPNHMNVKGFYDVYVNIENTGSKEAKFRIKLTQKGKFENNYWMYRLPSGELTPHILNIDYPSRLITIPFDSIEKVVYHEIDADLGSARHDVNYRKEGEMVFELYYGETLLDQVDLGKVVIDTSKSGYIKEIKAPQIMMRDMEYLVDVEIENTGYTTQGISKTFNLELASSDFKMSPVIMRDDIQSFTTDVWTVRIRPTRIGDFDLKFKLSYYKGFTTKDYNLLHELSVPVKVVSGYSTYIEKIGLPREVKLGDKFDLTVNLHNYGNERMITLRLRAPDFMDKPIEKMIDLSPTSSYSTVFEVEATKAGKIPITLEILPKQEVITPGKNYDPYDGESYVINAKSAYITVNDDKIVVIPEEPDVIVKFVEPPAPDIITPEVVKPEEKAVKVNIVTALLLIIVVVLSLILLKVILTLRKKK